MTLRTPIHGADDTIRMVLRSLWRRPDRDFAPFARLGVARSSHCACRKICNREQMSTGSVPHKMQLHVLRRSFIDPPVAGVMLAALAGPPFLASGDKAGPTPRFSSARSPSSAAPVRISVISLTSWFLSRGRLGDFAIGSIAVGIILDLLKRVQQFNASGLQTDPLPPPPPPPSGRIRVTWPILRPGRISSLP